MNRTAEEGGGGAGGGGGGGVAEVPEAAASTALAAIETTLSVELNEDAKLTANEKPITNDAAHAPIPTEANAEAADGKDKIEDGDKAKLEATPKVDASSDDKDKEKDNAPPVKKKRKSPAVPWKKPQSMPKRPLSAYNLYFQDERKRLLLAKESSKASASTSVALGVESERSLDDLGASSRSGSSWNSGGTSIGGGSASRKHVAVSGLGFASLAKTVAAKWKSLDAVTKLPYEERAAEDKKRYDEQVAEWREKERKKKEAAKAAAAAAKKKKLSLPSTPPIHSLAKGTEGISPPDHHSLGSISDTYPHDWFETGTATINVPRHDNALTDESSRTNASSLYDSSRTNASSYALQQHQLQHQRRLGDLSPMHDQQQAYPQQMSLSSSMQRGPVNPFAGDELSPAPPQNRFDSLHLTMQGQSVQGGSNNINYMPAAVEAFVGGGGSFNPHQYQQQHQPQQEQGPQRMNIPQNRAVAFSLQPRRMMVATNNRNASSSLQADEDLRFFGQASPMAVTSIQLQTNAAAQNNMGMQSSSTMILHADQAGYPPVEPKMHDIHQDSTISNTGIHRFSQSPFDPPSRAELGYHRPMNAASMDTTLMAAPTSRLQLQNFQPPPTGMQQQSTLRLQQPQQHSQHSQQQLLQQHPHQQAQEQFQSQWDLGGGGLVPSSASIQQQQQQLQQHRVSQNLDVNNPNAHNDSNTIGLGHIRRVEEMRAEDVGKQQQLQHQQYLERQRRQQHQILEQQRRQQMLAQQRRQQLLEEQRMLQQRQLQVQQQLQQQSLQTEAPNAGTGSGGGENLYSIRETLDDDMISFLTHLQNGNGGSGGSQHQQQQQGDYAFPLPPPS